MRFRKISLLLSTITIIALSLPSIALENNYKKLVAISAASASTVAVYKLYHDYVNNPKNQNADGEENFEHRLGDNLGISTNINTHTNFFSYPVEKQDTWDHQSEFVSRLKYIQSKCEKKYQYAECCGITELMTISYDCNGFIPHITGYYDPKYKMFWSQEFSEYVEAYNIKPTRTFYRYVMNYPLFKNMMDNL